MNRSARGRTGCVFCQGKQRRTWLRYRYYCSVENDTIFCNHAEVEEYVVLYPTHSVLDMENKPVGSLSGENIETITLSLLSENGEVGTKLLRMTAIS